ncbi:hypothetical protein Pse7429DRAFT_1231 [Pseudanabaena biceps PCC 7429]|uniref:Uncharacterized protein n=1 Tax=Pseudanabaena biceps PCC 7429 TaxID=927668 RepID=L8N2E0_9CYAN|nr:hypothetical protein Pse7429DRAFT_1231 [Pseudanabaena biceps PCC 7429]
MFTCEGFKFEISKAQNRDSRDSNVVPSIAVPKYVHLDLHLGYIQNQFLYRFKMLRFDIQSI